MYTGNPCKVICVIYAYIYTFLFLKKTDHSIIRTIQDLKYRKTL